MVTQSGLKSKKPEKEKIQTQGEYVCEMCNKNLTRQLDLYLGRFKFYCDQCKKGFVNGIDYKVHMFMNKHAGIMYRCSMCTKTFSEERSRDYHMSTNTRI